MFPRINTDTWEEVYRSEESEENGIKYRLGIHTTRLTQNMNDITKNIKEAREYGL